MSKGNKQGEVSAVKVYLYGIESGVYQGEDFADSAFLKLEERELPPGCTTIAPPEFVKGEVPVFEADHHRWVVRPVSAVALWPQSA